MGAVSPASARPLAILKVVVLDCRAARVTGRRPHHVNARSALRRYQRRGWSKRFFFYVHYVYGHHYGIRAPVLVIRLHCHRVASLGLPVVLASNLRLYLSRARINGETVFVRPLQSVGERVVVVVHGCYSRADVPRAPHRRVPHGLRKTSGSAHTRKFGSIVLRRRLERETQPRHACIGKLAHVPETCDGSLGVGVGIAQRKVFPVLGSGVVGKQVYRVRGAPGVR